MKFYYLYKFLSNKVILSNFLLLLLYFPGREILQGFSPFILEKLLDSVIFLSGLRHFLCICSVYTVNLGVHNLPQTKEADSIFMDNTLCATSARLLTITPHFSTTVYEEK